MDANAPFADGVLVDLNLWGHAIIRSYGAMSRRNILRLDQSTE
jgi:hypothetical protein